MVLHKEAQMKKINPRRRPATMQDVERVKRAAQEEAITNAMATRYANIAYTIMLQRKSFN